MDEQRSEDRPDGSRTVPIGRDTQRHEDSGPGDRGKWDRLGAVSDDLDRTVLVLIELIGLISPEAIEDVDEQGVDKLSATTFDVLDRIEEQCLALKALLR